MKFRSIYLLAVALITIAFASCKKDLLKTNTNPTTVGPNSYNPNFTLTTVQLMYTGSGDFAADNWQTEWGGIAGYVQHIASTNTSYYYGDKYLLSIGNVGEYFDQAYSTQVQPVVDLIHLTAGKSQYNNLHQMGRIMRALVFQRLTDMYGDVPYSQAGLGYYDRIYTPVYDSQQSIYNDMLKEVSQAVDSLNSNGDVATGDMFYYNPGITASAQVAEWKKFGNSLLLRLAMRLTKIDPATAQSWVTKVAANVMSSNDDNAIVQHTNTINLNWNRDAWSILLEDSTDVKLCSTFIDTLKNNNDPRIRVYSWIFPTKDTTLADQIGLPPGYIVGGLDPTVDITKQPGYPVNGLDYYSRINDDILNLAAPNFIITYAQTEFLLADAAQRWGIGGDAATLYKQGVEAAFTQLAAYNPPVVPSQAMADAYLAAHPYNSATGLSQINTQYWICCLMDEYEAWANWRRTSTGDPTTGQLSGYPALKPTNYKANVTNGTIPRRLNYPTDQSFSNPTNYKAAVARLKGGDVQTARVWWDTDTKGSN